MQRGLHRTEPEPPGDGSGERQPAELQTLRRLLVGPEQSRLDHVERAIASPESLGQVLPEAIARAAQTRRVDLATALEQPVGTALHDVARRNPGLFGEILAPTIGTAVRRALGEAIAKLMQHMNRLLDRGFSLHSIRWRIEAIRTGKPLAEVVLAHTLIFRVEWVVLIDNDTSLVLEQAAAPEVVTQAPNQTSAMLQAINSFVRDAFQRAAPGGELESIEVGDLSVWIERDAAFTVAAAIRGAPPARLRDKLRETLERIRTLHHDPGPHPDAASFADAHPLLAECLDEEQRTARRKNAQWSLGLAGLAALLAIGMCSYHRVTDTRHAAALRGGYLAALGSAPGIVVTSIERTHEHLRINGLVDPRATPPADLIARAGLPPAELALAPFRSLDPRIEQPMAAADAAIRDLEQIAVEFAPGDAAVAPGDAALRRAGAAIARAQRAAAAEHAGLCVELLGDSDEHGGEHVNDQLRAERAVNVARALQAAGVAAAVLAPRAGDPMRPRAGDRRVTFRALLRPDASHRACTP